MAVTASAGGRVAPGVASGVVEDPRDEMVDRHEAARLTGRSAGTIDSWSRAGLLPAAGSAPGARGRPTRVYRLRDVFQAERLIQQRRGYPPAQRQAATG
jgi:hypothetical protein